MDSSPTDTWDADVLVLGASFAGLEVVYQLVRRADRAPLRIVAVDKQAAHGYLPLVQERLCGRIDPEVCPRRSTWSLCRDAGSSRRRSSGSIHSPGR
jgi:NADH dehydrogenase FAD-containing subunit